MDQGNRIPRRVLTHIDLVAAVRDALAAVAAAAGVANADGGARFGGMRFAAVTAPD